MSEPIPSDLSASFTSSIPTQKHYTEDEITALVTAIHNLKNEVKELMIKQAINEFQMPSELVVPAVDSYMKQNYKLGRPPMEAEIQDAISKTKTMKAAADYLGISTTTLRRYCTLYQKTSEGGTTLSLWRPTRGTKVSKSTLP